MLRVRPDVSKLVFNPEPDAALRILIEDDCVIRKLCFHRLNGSRPLCGLLHAENSFFALEHTERKESPLIPLRVLNLAILLAAMSAMPVTAQTISASEASQHVGHLAEGPCGASGFQPARCFQRGCMGERTLKPFISSAALAEVENCQPYNTLNGVPNQAAIWVLHKLDIIDKHRLLLVARDEFAVKQFWFSAEDLLSQHFVLPDLQWKPMEDGAEIIRFRITGGPPRQTKVNVKIEATRSVQFMNTGLCCDGMPIASVLHQLGTAVEAIIRDFGRDFFGE